jgi:hypothetical protein
MSLREAQRPALGSVVIDRFKQWCIKLSPHLRNVYSLGEHLRDASVAKRHVLDCLGSINDALEKAQKMPWESERNVP